MVSQVDRHKYWAKEYDKVRRSKKVSIVGSGFVGVELAAELLTRNAFNKVHVELRDFKETILPGQPQECIDYAMNFLESTGRCTFKLGDACKNSQPDGDIAYQCVGLKPRLEFLDARYKDKKGFAQCNSQMQVCEEVEGGSLNPWNEGRVFAVGDCAEVQGTPLTKAIFYGEETASIASNNLLASCAPINRN